MAYFIWYQNFNIILLRVKCYCLEHHGDNLKQIETPQESCSKMAGGHPGVKLKLGFDRPNQKCIIIQHEKIMHI